MTVMQPTTFDTETELSSVNSILASIGQAPIPRLNFENPQIALIYQLLQEASSDVQNEGWVYNTECYYPLTPNAEGIIEIPENVLRMDVSDNEVIRTTDVVQRDGKLYNKMDHSYIFEGTFHMDIVWKFPYKDLPSVFKRYITAKASSRAATQIIGNPQLAQMLQQQEAMTRASCVEYECNQGDYTFFGTPQGAVYRPFQPYRTFHRT